MLQFSDHPSLEENRHNLRPVPVEGMAGDFIIWHQALPHCATPNRGPAPRMVQYLTCLPDHRQDQNVWL